MNTKKKMLTLLVLDVLAGLDIFWTVYLGNFADWTLYNLSVVGYWYGHEWELRIWGWLTSILFVSFLIFLLKLYKQKKKVPYVIAASAGVILSIGVVIPYQPIPLETSFISNMHIACSLIAPLCLVACITYLLIANIKTGIKSATPMLIIMIGLLAVAAYIFIKYTIITTVLELYTVSAISVFLTILVFLAPKEDNR